MNREFQEIQTIADRLNQMPIAYRDITGRVCNTRYTTLEFCIEIYNKVDRTDNLEKSLRSPKDSCLNELDFKAIAIFINKTTDEAVTILGT